MRADVVNGEDVGMIECRSSTRFLLESQQAIAITRNISRQKFDRHISIKSRIMRPVDFAHASSANFGNDRVVGECRVGG